MGNSTRDWADLLGEWVGGTVGCERCDWHEHMLSEVLRRRSWGTCPDCGANWSYTPTC
jgi:hypothetical protein